MFHNHFNKNCCCWSYVHMYICFNHHSNCSSITGNYTCSKRYIGTYLNNIERHTAGTIVSWPNHTQWVIVNTSDSMMIIRQSIYILSFITREMGKLKTYSPTYCIMDNGENMFNLTHTLDKIYLTGILKVQISLQNDDHEMVYWTNKRVRSASQNVYEYLHSS